MQVFLLTPRHIPGPVHAEALSAPGELAPAMVGCGPLSCGYARAVELPTPKPQLPWASALFWGRAPPDPQPPLRTKKDLANILCSSFSCSAQVFAFPNFLFSVLY